MDVLFLTGNRHKFDEVKRIFDAYGISLAQLDEEKVEPKEWPIEKVAKYNAELFFRKTGKPVCVDDTGIFFKAYPEFPGNHPKLMFSVLGYKGILKLIEGEDRAAQFRTAVAYCGPEGTKSFIGSLDGEITTEAHFLDKDVMPYERIFRYNGKLLCEYSREDKNSFSHRGKAFRKLAAWISGLAQP